MKVTIITSLPAKRDMDINACHYKRSNITNKLESATTIKTYV
jgi:hypothetical protein